MRSYKSTDERERHAGQRTLEMGLKVCSEAWEESERRKRDPSRREEGGNLGLRKACLRVIVSNLAGVVSLQK